MAVTKTILKLTNTEAIVKVTGLTGDTTTISLATDLLLASEALVGGTQKVNIASVVCYGIPGGYVTLARNSVTILNIANDGLQMADFQGDPFVPDSINNTNDIVVTVSTSASQVYIYLKKVSGYKSTDSISTQNS